MNRRCVDPADLRRRDGNPVLVSVERASGPVWVHWSAEPHPASVRRSAESACPGNRHPALDGEPS